MMIRLFPFLLLLLFITASCRSKMPVDNTKSVSTSNESFRIAFGSCSHQDKPQLLWDEILAEKPDAWIWLGDNIYGDSEDMSVLRAKYDMQNANVDYQKLKASTEILGTWDDHDYGINDGGRHYTKRAESQKEFLRFLDVSKDDVRWNRSGIYSSKEFESDGITIKIILLDTRYFRDDPIKEDINYLPNTTGTVLGADQWIWLEKELSNSNADVHIIGSGYQVIAEEHRFEKWSNFPNERKRLFDLFKTYEIPKPIIITGDRHTGEVSKLSHDGYTIYDITSSSLTHEIPSRRPETNMHRIGNLIYDENYGLLEIQKTNGQIAIEVSLKTEGAMVLENKMLTF